MTTLLIVAGFVVLVVLLGQASKRFGRGGDTGHSTSDGSSSSVDCSSDGGGCDGGGDGGGD